MLVWWWWCFYDNLGQQNFIWLYLKHHLTLIRIEIIPLIGPFPSSLLPHRASLHHPAYSTSLLGQSLAHCRLHSLLPLCPNYLHQGHRSSGSFQLLSQSQSHSGPKEGYDLRLYKPFTRQRTPCPGACNLLDPSDIQITLPALNYLPSSKSITSKCYWSL